MKNLLGWVQDLEKIDEKPFYLKGSPQFSCIEEDQIKLFIELLIDSGNYMQLKRFSKPCWTIFEKFVRDELSVMIVEIDIFSNWLLAHPTEDVAKDKRYIKILNLLKVTVKNSIDQNKLLVFTGD